MLLFFSATAGAAPGRGPLTPKAELTNARDAFRAGKYRKAIPLLNYLLYPKAKLANTSTLVEAHLMLGICHFETGNTKLATREFEEALFLDPQANVDTELASQPAVLLFQKTREELRKRAQDDAQRLRLAQERAAYKEALKNLVVIEKRPYYINFIPFGAGQFQNGESRKGVFFFVSETIFGGTSAGLFLWQTFKYGLGGRVPQEDAELVRRVQQIQVVTGGVALGLMAWGIIDSLIHYKPSIQRKADESLLPKRLRYPVKQPPTSHKLKTPNLKLTPALGPNSAGAAFTWTF